MKRGNTALKRVVSVASVAAMAIAGAVLAAPAASAATAAANNVRTAPTADAVWLNATGAQSTTASTTVNTYGADSKTGVPVVGAGNFVKVADVQVKISAAWAANDTFEVTLPAGLTFASAPTVQWTKQPVDLSKLANLAGFSGTNASAAPAATGVTVVDAAAPTSSLTTGTVADDTTEVKFAAAAPTPTSGAIGATAGYLLTLSNIRLVIPASNTLATQGGAIDVTVADNAGVPTTAATTVAYVAPVAVAAASTSSARSFNGTVNFSDITISELVPNAFNTVGNYTLTLTSDKVPTSGSVALAGSVTNTLSTGAGVTVATPVAASGTTYTAVLAGTDAATTKSTLTISGLQATNVPVGANLTLKLTSPTLAASTSSTFSNVANWSAGAITVSTSAELPRLAGSNRYATAWQIAKAFVGTGNTANVILANGTNAKDGADALAANFLAGSLGAPILLTEADTLPTETQYALLDVTKGAGNDITVYVMGKSDSVSQGVRDKVVALLKAAGHSNATVKEVAGDNRFETSAAVVKQAGAAKIGAQPLKSGAAYLPTAFLASGSVNADALAAGGVSYAAKVPVLLTAKDALSDDVKAAIKDNGITQVIILGATDRVSDAVKDSLADLGVTSVDRFAGSDRYATAQIIAEWNWTVAGNTGSQVLLANGTTGWPDALSAGPLAGKNTNPLLTVQKDSLGDSATKFLKDHKAVLTNGVEALGSAAGSVADSVITAAQDALK